MAKLSRKAGSTSEIWQIFIQDSSSLTGAGLTGLLNNTTSLTAYFHRDTDTTATVINLVSMTAGTFTSSGFIEIDATNMPGCYQFCPPNTALAAGAKSCLILLKGAANMAPVVLEVDLLNDSNVVWWNGTVVATPATAGIPDVNVKNINNVSTGSVTTINANQGTTQPVNFTGTAGSALVKGDTVDWAGTAVSTPTVAGVPNVNAKTWNDLATVALPLVPTVAGRALDVSAGGEAGVDWANVGSPTTTLDLSGTTIKTTQKVDVDTIKTNPVVNGGTVTFPTNATLASTTNITAGTITTVTNVTNRVTANTDQVAGDATAATNLASTFNGTGYTAATAPATQSQVSNIAVTGAALNATAASRTLTTGTETNAYTDTFTDDGVYHTITQAGGAIDIYYEFSLGSTGQTGVGAFWQGYVAGIVNSIKVYAYNWGNAAWDQIGTLLGISNTVAADADFALTNDHTGTGGNLGKVRIRFSNTGLTAATLNTDRMLLGYAVVVSYPSNFSALAISAGGHISNVDTLTTYTGDTPQTGDAYAIVNSGTFGNSAIKGYVDDIGVAGAGLTALGDARIANLDAAVSTRSTYAGGAVASVTGAVGSVTGNVGGNVVGSVGSVTAAVTIAAASVQAIWDALTSALSTVGSIGKLLVDNINATISSRLASGTVASDVTAIKAKTDNLPAAPAATSDCITAAGVRSAVGLASANLDTQIGTLATPTNITAGTLTTVTNLTNAPTAGDLTAAMKASVTTAATAATPTVATVSGAVGSVTGNVGGNVTGSVGSLATQAKADVNAEVVDALSTDTYAEPGQGTPAATLSLAGKIGYLFKSWRNKSTQTSSQYSLYNDDAATVDQKATATDDATTFTRGEMSTGP